MPAPSASSSGLSQADFQSQVNAAMDARVPNYLAASPPPPVGDTSIKGSTGMFADAGHTHQSSVQAARLTVGTLTGGYALVNWTFSKPFPVGSVPVCSAVCENVSSTDLPFVVNMVAPATNTGAQFIVFKTQKQTLGATLLAIAGMVIAPFVNAPSGTVINAIARLPSA